MWSAAWLAGAVRRGRRAARAGRARARCACDERAALGGVGRLGRLIARAARKRARARACGARGRAARLLRTCARARERPPEVLRGGVAKAVGPQSWRSQPWRSQSGGVEGRQAQGRVGGVLPQGWREKTQGSEQGQAQGAGQMSVGGPGMNFDDRTCLHLSGRQLHGETRHFSHRHRCKQKHGSLAKHATSGGAASPCSPRLARRAVFFYAPAFRLIVAAPQGRFHRSPLKFRGNALQENRFRWGVPPTMPGVCARSAGRLDIRKRCQQKQIMCISAICVTIFHFKGFAPNPRTCPELPTTTRGRLWEPSGVLVGNTPMGAFLQLVLRASVLDTTGAPCLFFVCLARGQRRAPMEQTLATLCNQMPLRRKIA